MNSKRKSKAIRRIIMLIVVIIVIGAIAIMAMRPKKIAYESVKATTGDILTYYSFSGNVETKNRETILAEKIMQIDEIKVEEGDLVKEGDILFTTTTEDEIEATIDGEVSQLNVEESEQVMAGIPLMEIVDYENLKIKIKVDEYDLSALEVGEEATIMIGAIDKEIKGTIKDISKEGQVVNGVTFFTATIDLVKEEGVKVGMTAEVKIQNSSAFSVVTLPMDVIQFDEKNLPYVILKGEDETMVDTKITTGINDGTNVEIISGIASGDTVYYKSVASSAGGFGFRSSRGEN